MAREKKPTPVAKNDLNPQGKKIRLNERLKIEVIADFGFLRKGDILSPQKEIAEAYIKNKVAKKYAEK